MWRTASILIVVVLTLLTLGLVMLASATPSHASGVLDQDPYIRKQLAALVLGLIGAFIASRVEYRVWRPLAVPIAIAVTILLVLVLVPGVGSAVKGSRRWLNLGPVSMQPSEFAKISLVLLLAWWMSNVQRKASKWRWGMMWPTVMMGVPLALVFVEPDFGTTMLLGAVGFAVLFIGGARFSHLAVVVALGLAFISIAIAQDAERTRRIIAFMDPEKYATDEAFQLLNAIYAFVVGRGTGVGLGASLQKRYYLPEAHTDFIFAIIGEELGLVATLGVVALFLAFFICGLRIAMRASDMFGRLVAFGITCMITLQAAINIAVVTGSMPTKGLPLPFISYGGTSIAVSLFMVGLLVNIALHAGGETEAEGPSVARDRARRL